MKVMTFNTQHCVNYLKGCIDYELMASVIRDSGADVVALNEMYSEREGGSYPDQTAILSELTGLGYHYFAEAIVDNGKDPYGNGLISRIPIVKAETVLIPDPAVKKAGGYYETRCVLKAELEGGLRVLVTHFGLVDDEQKNAVCTVLENIKDEKCILMGDLNVEPSDPLLAPIRSRMRDTAESFSSLRLSWPSDKPRKKIDYIFISNDIELISADIPSIVASDHRPYIAEINLK